jgi:flagellin
MRINKNIYSLNIFKNYTKNVKNNATALERISSGKKVNSSKDNPIKIERSENINIKIRALQKANGIKYL